MEGIGQAGNGRKSRVRANPFTVGTKYGKQISQEQDRLHNPICVAPDSESTSLDRRLSSILGLFQEGTKPSLQKYKELMCGLIKGSDDFLQMSFDCMHSTRVADPNIRAAMAIMFYSVYDTHTKVERVEEETHDLRCAKKSKVSLVVQDQFELTLRDRSLDDEDVIIILPKPYRTINVRAAVREVISNRSPVTRNRSIVLEMTAVWTNVLKQMFIPGEERRFIYGNKRLKGFEPFDEIVARRVSDLIVHFIGHNAHATDMGYTSPPVDRELYRGMSMSLLTTVLADGPNRRSVPRYQYMPDELYIATLASDSMNTERIRAIEEKRFGYPSTTLLSHVRCKREPHVPNESPSSINVASVSPHLPTSPLTFEESSTPVSSSSIPLSSISYTSSSPVSYVSPSSPRDDHDHLLNTYPIATQVSMSAAEHVQLLTSNVVQEYTRL